MTRLAKPNFIVEKKGSSSLKLGSARSNLKIVTRNTAMKKLKAVYIRNKKLKFGWLSR